MDLALQTGRGTAPEMVILRERGNDVRIARVLNPRGGTVIIKLWNRPTLRGVLRRLTRTNIGWQEYAALQRLVSHHIGTPIPLGYLRLHDSTVPYTEALVSSDLGECADSTEYFKALLQAKREGEVREFEDHLVRTTAGLLAAGLIDTDHRLPNFVVTTDGLPVRLDFELCRFTRCVACHPRQVGLMFGALLGSYTFAVQPDIDRVVDFAARLRAATQPSSLTRHVASYRVAGDLARQTREKGVEIMIPDLWVGQRKSKP